MREHRKEFTSCPSSTIPMCVPSARSTRGGRTLRIREDQSTTPRIITSDTTITFFVQAQPYCSRRLDGRDVLPWRPLDDAGLGYARRGSRDHARARRERVTYRHPTCDARRSCRTTADRHDPSSHPRTHVCIALVPNGLHPPTVVTRRAASNYSVPLPVSCGGARRHEKKRVHRIGASGRRSLGCAARSTRTLSLEGAAP